MRAQEMRSAVKCLVLLSLLCLLSIGQTASLQSPDTKLDPQIYDDYLGTYQLPSGEFLVIGRSARRLYYFEPSTGLARGLDRPVASSTLNWVGGPSFLIFTPAAFQVTFLKKDSKIVGLTVKKGPNQPLIAKKVYLYHEEKVSFDSGGTTLAGTLLLPSTKGPHPAVVFVHGSGDQDRNGFVSLIRLVADDFARHGIATLTYDKRGVGASGGDWSKQTLDDLADDALAACKILKGRSDIDPKQIGLWGSSQAAWIMPKMTAKSNDIAFIISVSGAGSGISVGEQVLYNLEIDLRNAKFNDEEISEWKRAYRLLYGLLRAGENADTKPLEDLVRKLQANPKLTDSIRENWFLARPNPKIDWKKRDQWFFLYDPNFDAIPLWERYSGPVLGIFGELDGLNPVREVVPIFARVLARRKNTDFTIAVFPKAHHILMEMETDTPNDNELPNLKRYAPGYFETMTGWLLRHVTLRSPTSGRIMER